MNPPVLEAVDLRLSFGSIRALDGVSFKVHADELLSSLDRSVSASKEFLGHLTPSQAEAPWRLTMRGQDVCTVYGRSADDDPFV